jgi:beta-xylosidase
MNQESSLMNSMLILMKYVITISFLLFLIQGFSQEVRHTSKAWNPDIGNGIYRNPVIHADYSDPDAIRVGDDFYMVSSSFENIPGLPILHSRDLVNWTIAGHALKRLPPFDHFSRPRHGEGVWAPSIRYHGNTFYIYYPDPDFGIYMVKSKSINGPWTEPAMVQAGKGLIDPCPLWDDDGKVYLVHAYAGSRAGFKSVIVVKQMNAEGSKVLEEGVLVFDGHERDATVEGPKFYKRNGYYYIFAPAGGVSTGWQLVLRSKNIYGPYERRVVMDQGSTVINGPHQGAWVQTKTGEDWFLHFQDKGAYGRVVHLQPMKWVNDWPVIGIDRDGDGKGEPVVEYQKPKISVFPASTNPQESDEFNGKALGLQWQWQANSQLGWAFPFPAAGSLRLYAQQIPDSIKNYWDLPFLLTQKFPAETFIATVRVDFKSKLKEDKFGLIILGTDYAYLSITRKDEGVYLSLTNCLNAERGNPESEKNIQKIDEGAVYLRVHVSAGGKCQFLFSRDGQSYLDIGDIFVAKPGRWTGAKLGVFCSRKSTTNDAGYAELDWFRIDGGK